MSSFVLTIMLSISAMFFVYNHQAWFQQARKQSWLFHRAIRRAISAVVTLIYSTSAWPDISGFPSVGGHLAFLPATLIDLVYQRGYKPNGITVKWDRSRGREEIGAGEKMESEGKEIAWRKTNLRFIYPNRYWFPFRSKSTFADLSMVFFWLIEG